MTYLSDSLYRQVTESVPLPCIDLLPVKQVGASWNIGIIVRATGTEADKPAILGGRIYHNETITDAIKRHMNNDWGITKYTFFRTNSEERPFRVQQYLHQNYSNQRLCYDPTKHAISLVYLIELKDEPKPKNEASDFFWINSKQIPVGTAYNQEILMKMAFDYLDKPSVC